MQSIRAEVQEKEVGITSLTRRIDQKRDQMMDSHKKLSELEREVNELNSQKVGSLLIFNATHLVVPYV